MSRRVIETISGSTGMDLFSSSLVVSLFRASPTSSTSSLSLRFYFCCACARALDRSMTRKFLIISTAVATYWASFEYFKSRKDPVQRSFHRVLPEQPTSVVVGTGIVGLTSAYYLAKKGHRVICIEKREDVALETSYKNGALICPSLLTPWANVDVPKNFFKSLFTESSSSAITSIKIWPNTWLSPTFYRWIYEYLKNCTAKAQMRNATNLLNLSLYSRQCLNDILNEVPISFSRCSTGSLQLAVNSHIYEVLIEESKHIPNIQLLSSADEVVKLEPMLTPVKDRLHAGIFSGLDTNGNIHQFCSALKQILIDKYHVKFYFNHEVKDFQVTVNDRQQRHIHGIITANDLLFHQIDNVIVANGNYMMPLMKKLNIYIPVYPVKGYVVEIKTPPNISLPKVNLVDDVNKLYISALQPTASQGIVRVSGLAEFAGWEDIGTLSEPARAQYLYDQTISWLPHLASYEKSFHSCSRPVSPDDVPLIGRCDDFDNLFVNCGHGSKGWTLAFGSAALLAQIVDDSLTKEKTQTSLDPEPYSPNRF